MKIKSLLWVVLGSLMLELFLATPFFIANAQDLQTVTNNGATTSREITTGGYSSVLAYTNKLRPFLVSANYRSGWIMETNGSINWGLWGNQPSGFVFRWLAHNGSGIDYSSNNDELMRLTFDGKLGLGTINPQNKLDVSGQGAFRADGVDDATGLYIRNSDGNNRFALNVLSNGWVMYDNNGIWNKSIASIGGNIGIGTTTPREKLSVNGKIRAQEIKVEVANWPDYVFEGKYHPFPLMDLETFIKVNKHLPEIPSAKEAEENGISLGEMNAKLLKKIEELTLHLIDQEKRIQELEKKLKFGSHY